MDTPPAAGFHSTCFWHSLGRLSPGVCQVGFGSAMSVGTELYARSAPPKNRWELARKRGARKNSPAPRRGNLAPAGGQQRFPVVVKSEISTNGFARANSLGIKVPRKQRKGRQSRLWAPQVFNLKGARSAVSRTPGAGGGKAQTVEMWGVNSQGEIETRCMRTTRAATEPDRRGEQCLLGRTCAGRAASKLHSHGVESPSNFRVAGDRGSATVV